MALFSSRHMLQLNIIITELLITRHINAIVPFKFERNLENHTDIVVADLRRSDKFNPIDTTQISQC